MMRKTLRILSLIGLLLSVGLWGLSYWYVICSYPPVWTTLVLRNGHLEITRSEKTYALDPQRISAMRKLLSDKGADSIALGGAVLGWMYFSDWKTTWWSFTFEQSIDDTTVGFPLWLPCLVFAVLPAYTVGLFYRRRKRKRLDHGGSEGQYARIKTALFPELRRFETQTERRAAWKSANRTVLVQPLYWLCIASLIAVMMSLSFVSVFDLLIVSLVILLVWTYVTFVLVARRTIQQTLRKRLIERGVPICLKCGYDLRESMDRCPECGTGFSN